MASIRKRAWKTASGEVKTAWVVDYSDNRGKRQRKHFSHKKAADAFRIRVEGQMQTGTYRPDADKVTVRELCESFLEHCAGRNERNERMTRKMLAVYKGHVKNYILHPDYGFGSRKLSQFTARSAGDFRDRLRNAGVTVPTTRKILATLHSALAYAISQDWLATNAAHGIKVIGSRDEGSKRIISPSKEDLLAIIDMADEDFRLTLQFAASTGVRAGEQWAARWRDIDLENRRFHISRRVDVYREQGAPKTFVHKDDPVTVPLPLRRFNWHALRHFAVSCWIEAGFTPKTVQTFAGHASLQVTMDRYGHLFPSDDHHKTMDQISKGLFG